MNDKFLIPNIPKRINECEVIVVVKKKRYLNKKDERFYTSKTNGELRCNYLLFNSFSMIQICSKRVKIVDVLIFLCN